MQFATKVLAGNNARQSENCYSAAIRDCIKVLISTSGAEKYPLTYHHLEMGVGSLGAVQSQNRKGLSGRNYPNRSGNSALPFKVMQISCGY